MAISADPTTNDYYRSFEEFFKDTIKRLDGRIGKRDEKIKQIKSEMNKQGFLGKIQSKMDLSEAESAKESLESKKSMIGKMDKLLFKFLGYHSYEIDPQSASSLESVSSYLSEEERRTLKSKVSACIKKYKDGQEVEIDKVVEEIKDLRKKSEIVNKISIVNHATKDARIMSIDMALDNYKSTILDRYNLRSNSWDIDTIVHNNQRQREREESDLKKKIDIAMKDPSFQKTYEYTQIKKNYDRIVKYIEIKEHYLIEATNISGDLKGIDGRIFGEVRDYLKQVSQSRKDEYKKAVDFLSKFNFTKLEAVAERIEEKEKKEKEKEEREQRIKDKYGKAVEELERMKYNGGNVNEMTRLKQEIANMERSDVDLFETKMGALAKVNEEVKEKEEKKAMDEDKKEKERRLKVALDDLNQEAESRLEFRNRSLWKFNSDSKERKDELRKIKGQIVQEAKLSVEERTLYQMKVEGVVDQKATLETLTPQQKSMFRQLYQHNKAYERPYYETIRAYQEMAGDTLEDDISMHI